MNSLSNFHPLLGKYASTVLPRVIGAHGKQRLSILIYHRVLPYRDELHPSIPVLEEFSWQMEILARHFNPLSLSDALLMMDEGRLPERAACVTFDDGYADNESVALPVLQKWGVPATVFVATGFLNGGRMWNDTVTESIRSLAGNSLDLEELGLGRYSLATIFEQREALNEVLTTIKHWSPDDRIQAVNIIESKADRLPVNLMMTENQVRSLDKNGIEIGGHTVSHPILATLDAKSAWNEIKQNKEELEILLGKPIRYFAYPNGRLGQDYTLTQRDMVKRAGYQAALSTHKGVVSAVGDRWQMARFTPWDKSPQRFLIRLLLNTAHLVCSPDPI